MFPNIAVDMEHWCLKCAEYRVGVGSSEKNGLAWKLVAMSPLVA
jgi:hypothetical protein